MLMWLSRLVLLLTGTFSARAYARDFVGEYIRRLVRERLRAGLVITVTQLALLALTAFVVHRLGDPLAGRIFGSTLVWVLIAYNVNRFFTSTVPDIAMARRHLSGPVGYVIRDLLGISIAKELVEMELFVLAVCLVLGLYARFGVSSTFHLLAPWRELVAIRRVW
jgi:hypothetical protein